MYLLHNISRLYSCAPQGGQDGVHPIANAAIAWDGANITWVGAEKDLPSGFSKAKRIDAKGAMVIPGLIDCHTHLAFGGWRADEFEERMRGTSYAEIAQRGGGIMSTVRKTRAANEEDLLARCRDHIAEMTKLGVTTVECKSGYGLEIDCELKLLRVYKELAKSSPVTIVPTFLGAHAIPAEYRAKRTEFVHLITEVWLPAVAQEGLAKFCDVFMEQIAFSSEEARAILDAGKKHGLRPKVHADQLSDGGGAALAAEVGAMSADHLEHTSATGIARMAEAKVVAVTLPIATLYTREKPLQARPFIQAGVPIAVATDFNPGTAPSYHLPFAMTLACTMSGMTPSEALKGATYYAAQALGLQAERGSLEVGKAADIAVIAADDVNQWLYHFRANSCVLTICGGRPL